jgi:hypothetical protein
MVKTRMGLASLRAKAGGVKGAGQQLQRTFFRKAKQLDSLKSVQVGQVQCHRKYYSIYVQHMDNSHELWHDFDQLTTLSIAVGHTRDFGRIIADNGILLLGGRCIVFLAPHSGPLWPPLKTQYDLPEALGYATETRSCNFFVPYWHQGCC